MVNRGKTVRPRPDWAAGEVRTFIHRSEVLEGNPWNDPVEREFNVYLPPGYDAGKAYPAVIVSGSWTTVKEQMAGLYAEKLAQEGFVTLAFDFRNFGESGGVARFYENPLQKVDDIRNAVTYLQG